LPLSSLTWEVLPVDKDPHSASLQLKYWHFWTEQHHSRELNKRQPRQHRLKRWFLLHFGPRASSAHCWKEWTPAEKKALRNQAEYLIQDQFSSN